MGSKPMRASGCPCRFRIKPSLSWDSEKTTIFWESGNPPYCETATRPHRSEGNILWVQSFQQSDKTYDRQQQAVIRFSCRSKIGNAKVPVTKRTIEKTISKTH